MKEPLHRFAVPVSLRVGQARVCRATGTAFNTAPLLSNPFQGRLTPVPPQRLAPLTGELASAVSRKADD